MKTEEITSRSKFALVLTAMKPLTAFLRIGYKNYTTKQTAFNAAMCYNLANAITGKYPEYSLDMSKLLVSKGDLTGSINGKAYLVVDFIRVIWDSNDTENSDIAMVAILNLEKGEAVFTVNGNYRHFENQDIHIPSDWKNDTVSVYLSFIALDKSKISDSSYLGDIVIK